jgi:hypothetical protein
MSKVCENISYQVSCDIVGCDVLAHNEVDPDALLD